jgi:hypothetical protein
MKSNKGTGTGIEGGTRIGKGTGTESGTKTKQKKMQDPE